MNIYALKGHKVRCWSVTNGYHYQQEIAKEHLTVDETYTVDYTEVGSSSTNVAVQEVPGVLFNSALFEDVAPQSEEDDKKHPDYHRYH